jgi:hypothetical protein
VATLMGCKPYWNPCRTKAASLPAYSRLGRVSVRSSQEKPIRRNLEVRPARQAGSSSSNPTIGFAVLPVAD